MKKVFLALALVLIAVFALSACTQTETTNATPRWGNEHLEFRISEAVLSQSDLSYDDQAYMLEPLASGYETNFDKLDQIVPEDAGGSYTMDIALSNGDRICTFTTSQKLYVQYKTELLQGFDILWNDAEFKKHIVTDADEIEKAGLSVQDDLTTLLSTTDTKVVFQNDSSQRPLSSQNVVDGFYIGKTWQGMSKYTTNTTYNWTEKNKLSVTVNGEERAVKGTYESKFIDANQILLYVRSLEKTSTKFKDSPSVTIYAPYSDSLKKASFVFTYECKTVVQHDLPKDIRCAKLNAVAVIVGGSALMVQLNLPDTINKNASLDTISDSGTNLNKYTTVRFRSGMFCYELASYSSAVLDALAANLVSEK